MREAEPETIRAKRQAYQVYAGGDVSVDKSGQLESGPWGPWAEERSCSRTCGGGVRVEKRPCNGAEGDCTGASLRYISCNVEECPDGPTDYRAEQCAKHNDDPLDGKYYKWFPYNGKNKCELTCKPETATFYYKWADKVVDGTKCDNLNDDICVDGVCLPLGCDRKLGSSSKYDKCAVCNGDGSTCKTVEGFFDERNLSPGYHDVISLPAGATSVKIEEIRPTSNNLALKNSSGEYFLNGNYQISIADKDVAVGGTVFKYEKPKGDGLTERLTARGPLKEELTVALLYQRGAGSKDSAIKYEFSIPLDQDVPYLYKPGEWSSCSVTCGKGVQTRTPFCIDTTNQQRVDDNLCDENNATKPEVEKPCQTVDCEAEWFEGDWEECSQSCGNTGLQYRIVYCHRVFADGRRITVNDTDCTAEERPRPEVRRSCNRFSCPEWHAGPWSACSEKCGDAKQYRSVTCRSEKEGDEGKLLPADHCDTEAQPENERDCNLGPCEGLTFHTTDWKLCERCNDTEETRNVTCKDRTGRIYPQEKCLTGNVTEIPTDTRSCATQPPCVYEWHTSEWSKCSTECGHGHKTRKVHCAIHEVGDIAIVEEALCQGEKPTEREECTSELDCTGTFFSGPWTECTEKCGGGKQSRIVVCLNYDKKPVPEWCDEAQKPAEEQNCNEGPCPTCHDSDFGCCPDNTTFAQGPFLEGCSNCTISEFGCCADNVTDATGPNRQGCPEYVEPEVEEASGEEGGEEVTAGPSEEEQCEVTSEETGETVKIPCASTKEPSLGDALLLSLNDTDENATKHCSKTEFGCCPDWYTPAEGPSFAGCPSFVLGACNDTQYGCCLDNVTLARGPNLEGCGEPTCAGSLFGCCKDRRTIAFGPHYAGCERSSFPCELSAYGCCPDGETAALGKNGTGCGANCLITKYGCCPDGVTVAKGNSNEGCGCEYSQYGCCPDGKSNAKGAGYYGCPETCAQSCPCQYTRWGCCPDGETTALGPLKQGCDDCRYAKYGCCPDGESKAIGPDYAGCPTTTPAPFLIGGTVAPSKIAACNLPQEQGQVCAPGYKLVWFYDTTEGRCSQFWFGGCAGNANNFASKEECETVCVEPPATGRCYLPKVEGPQRCNDLVARYWYDYTTKQCAAFWWRGCLGNSNNFESWEQCQTFCSGVGPIEEPIPDRSAFPLITSPPHLPPWTQYPQPVPQYEEPQEGGAPAPGGVLVGDEHCRLPAESSVACQDYRDRYYFDSYSGKCHVFIYSGCGGNPNNYETREECERSCGHLAADQSAKAPEVCNQRLDEGRCEGNFDSWYYEIATGTCQPFKYTGCGGNQNRFHSKAQCEDLCLRRLPSFPSRPIQPQAPEPIRQLPPVIGAGAVHKCEAGKDTGPCTNFVTKWYYNQADGTCNRFHYGGCEGNENRFETEQECKKECGDFVDTCFLPRVVGPCAGKNSRYYFDQSTKTCTAFEYSGCLGNNNNFRSLEDCEARCGANGSPSQ
ncbi:thrombospondin [Aphelenchoides avenae]|nr:thrombospondin [Aphelenchus avenae]